jgi:hypothetical protein
VTFIGGTPSSNTIAAYASDIHGRVFMTLFTSLSCTSGLVFAIAFVPNSAIREFPYLVIEGGEVKKVLNGKKGHDAWDFSLAYPLSIRVFAQKKLVAFHSKILGSDPRMLTSAHY